MMELSVSSGKSKTGLLFITVALASLLGGALFGCVGAIQFVFPEFLSQVPFFKVRPLHVSLVVSWIFFSAVGGIYYYLPRYKGLSWRFRSLKKLHVALYIITGFSILACYFAGKFGGREYWEFPPVLAFPVIFSWIVFGINYFSTSFSKTFTWPVYMWMWATGIFFFLFTFIESYLWVFPFFSNNHVRDITMQWKAYGALTGSWNMLVYGTAIFLMEQIKKDEKISHSRMAFLMYFLGFINLLFGWAHHTYIVPMAPWIRYFAYAISMTELLIFVKIIWNWRTTLSGFRRDRHDLAFRFIISSEIWIFINLTLAILISIPAVNLFTHGTHITVAHAMGSTIGINTMILLASCIFMLKDAAVIGMTESRYIRRGFWILNLSFLFFFALLVTAGSYKGYSMLVQKKDFMMVMNDLKPVFTWFAMSGIGLLSGLVMIVVPLITVSVRTLTRRQVSSSMVSVNFKRNIISDKD